MPDDLPIPEAIPDNVGMLEWFNWFSSWSGKYEHDGGRELSFFLRSAPRTTLTESLLRATLHVDIDNTAPLNVASHPCAKIPMPFIEAQALASYGPCVVEQGYPVRAQDYR